MARTKKTAATEEATEEKVAFQPQKKIKLFFFTEILGSCPADKEIYSKYIAKNRLDAPTIQDELQMVPEEEVIEQGTTCFLVRTHGKDKGKPCLASYTILGFMKEKTKFLRQEPGNGFDKFTNYKSKIDGNFNIDKPFITLHLPEGEEMGICQRPLRAETAQGPRVALASSLTCPPGTTCEFELYINNKEFNKYAIGCLKKGFLSGTGQWRSSQQKGRFLFEIYDADGMYIDGNTKEHVGCLSTDANWEEMWNDFLDEYRL